MLSSSILATRALNLQCWFGRRHVFSMGTVTSVRFAWHHASFWEQSEVGNSKMAISWESWIEGLACWLTLCILEKIICNSTNSVQISFIETLKLIVFSWTIWWCYWQNVLMINEKNNFLTVSWLSGLLSAEIFISTGEWWVQMPPLTSENSYFLRSGPQGTTLVMNFGAFTGPRRHSGLILQILNIIINN